jgi:glycosyltransferase involved in cell wall biosynthesis
MRRRDDAQAEQVRRPPSSSRVQRVQLCAPIDIEEWNRKFRSGLVANRLPYGFDQLEGPAVQVQTNVVAPPQRNIRGLIGAAGPRASGADWVVTWDERSAVAAMQEGIRAPRRASGLIWATDHIERSQRALEMKILRRYMRRLSVVWCLSRPQVDSARKWLGSSRGSGPRIEFLPFGINTGHFAYTAYPSTKTVLSLGNDPDRDPASVVAAMSEVRKADPRVRLIVQSTTLEHAPPGVELIRSIPHDELLRLYGAASVVLIATRHNSHVSGMTVALEAQSVGRPVVMTATPGTEDYLMGESGAPVAPGDVRGLAATVLGLLADPDRAAEIGRRARQRTEERHTAALMMTRLSDLLSLPN